MINSTTGASAEVSGRPLLDNKIGGKHVAGKMDKDDRNFIIYTIVTILVIVGAVYLRLWIAGGDWGCWFSADPALCAVVKSNE